MKSRLIISSLPSLFTVLVLCACSNSLPAPSPLLTNTLTSTNEPLQTLAPSPHATKTPSPSLTPVSYCSPARMVTPQPSINGHSSQFIHISQITSDFEIYSLAINPEGTTLAWGEGPDIYLWDIVENHLQRILKGHTGSVEYLEFSPNGRLLASGGGFPDASVRVWDVTSGDQLLSLEGQPQRVTSITFDVTGSVIASGGDDDTVRVWDVESGHLLRSFDGFASIAFSSDGQKLALGKRNGEVQLRNLDSDDVLFSLKENHTGRITNLSFSADTRILAAMSGPHLRLWDTSNGQLMHKFWGQPMDWILDFDIHVNDLILAFAGDDKDVRLCNIDTGALILVFSDVGTRVDFSSDGTKLAMAGGWNNLIRIWEFDVD